VRQFLRADLVRKGRVSVKIRKVISFTSVVALAISITSSASALTIPSTFEKFAKSATLAKPGIILIDPITQTEIYSEFADIPRAPASVLKLISAAAAITAFGPEKIFQTSISATDDPDTFMLQGNRDPWLTTSAKDAKRLNRALSTKLINEVINYRGDYSGLKIKFNGLFDADIESLRKFYGNKIAFKRVSKPPVIEGQESREIARVSSPTLREILEFTLLWSDNVLADRLAKNAAVAMGYSRDSSGVNLAFEETLNSLGVDATGLEAFDGSGLSHDNRVSARTIAELLLKIRTEQQFQAIYDGLPLSGKTGTLKKRFQKSASTAKGLVKAKTGWINTSVTLAGYVEAGESEYVFVVIANRVTPTEKTRDRAREIIDKMLATIAKPLEIAAVG
jgi:D-alanyl-D-alanine carboxypeptidase/D-alanyl-D-alanine-endopeptidase (penicillin-binding protein 4)